MKKKLFLNGIVLISMFSSFQYFQENSSPNVKIVEPDQNDEFSWNKIIPYEITINDKEDGYSEYDEIINSEVILTVQYLNDSSKVKNYLAQKIQKNYKVLSWMGSSNCFTCHAAKDKLIGPSFSEISNKYCDDSEQQDNLFQKIKSGGSGIWGNQIMPAHPDLDSEKVREAVKWILGTASNSDFSFYAGTQGAFRTRQKPIENKGFLGVYVLSGHYRDKGTNGAINTRKIGSQTIVLKYKE